uniref:Uncharacterized protein n=1 Tax=Neogobius melanostomus TaxID=47308 RepID=A0A8C6WNU6_9GOBI
MPNLVTTSTYRSKNQAYTISQNSNTNVLNQNKVQTGAVQLVYVSFLCKCQRDVRVQLGSCDQAELQYNSPRFISANRPVPLLCCRRTRCGLCSSGRSNTNMKLLYFVSTVSALLALCEGDSYWTSWTTAYPVGPGVDLRGKMVTLSQDSGVTFYPSYYQPAAEGATPATPTPQTTDWPSTSAQWQWTTTARPWWYSTTRPWWYTTTPQPPTTRGMSVCLRFVSDSSSFTLFKLAPRSPLSLTWNNPWYGLSWYYYSQVSLSPRISLWSSVRTQPWTSVCVVLDSLKNVVQVFQGGAMSIRKILSSRMVWSGEPVLEIPGFDGQVTDIEVWDYPLQYKEVFGYMQNYGPSGTVLTWSNIAYRPRGKILVEETYTQRSSRTISCSETEGDKGWDKRLKYKKKICARREKRRQML